MNGERPTVNGAHSANGTYQSVTDIPSSAGSIKQGSLPQHPPPPPPLPPSINRASDAADGDVESSQRTNGGGAGDNRAGSRAHAPAEILGLISQDSYLPMATLISRAS